MLAREFMSSPAATCSSSATLRSAAQEMERRNVGSLVVVADDGHIVGIVTDRDIAIRAIGHGQDANSTVEEVMSKHVVVILSDADVYEAAQKMARWGVRRMPVVGVSGDIEGVVALDDVSKAMSDEVAVLRRAVSTQMSGGPGWDET